jgi:hypothetical protein
MPQVLVSRIVHASFIVILGLAAVFGSNVAFSASSSEVQEAPAERPALEGEALALVEQLRRTYRSAPGIRVITTGSWKTMDGVLHPVRTQSMLTDSGEVKVLSPDRNLTLQNGLAYADSPFYPGYLVRQEVSRTPDGALRGLEEVWPLAPIPLEVRLRIGSSPAAAMQPLLDAVGADGSIVVAAAAWPDGSASRTLRFRSADDRTDFVVWVDLATGFIRGMRGSLAHDGGVDQIDLVCEGISSERKPRILVGVTNRTVIDSFDALQEKWSAVYSAPILPRR